MLENGNKHGDTHKRVKSFLPAIAVGRHRDHAESDGKREAQREEIEPRRG